MKLMIRFADKIVGAFIILALSALVFVIFMLGSSQRWFSRDYYFKTYFPSASGLSQNMAVQYRGFTIGHVKSIELTDDDRVEVNFTIFDTYIDRVRNGSLVEIQASPLAALGGNQFLFHPGLGDDLVTEGETIPSANSSEGKRLLAMGLASRPEQDDGISLIINRVGTLLGTVNDVLLDLQGAFEGTDQTSLGRTLRNVEWVVEDLQSVLETLPVSIEDAITQLMTQLEPILDNLHELSDDLANPDGTVMAILDSEGEVYTGLVSSLGSISAILRNLEKASDFIPPQLPRLAAILADLHAALLTAEDVLIALTNNPLLRGGVPERVETRTGGAQARDVEF